MYLKEVEIYNFRKFYYNGDVKKDILGLIEKGEKMERVKFSFVSAKDNNELSSRTTMIVGQNNTGKTTLSNLLNIISKNSKLKYYDINNKYMDEVCRKILALKEDEKEITLEHLPAVGTIITMGLDDERDNILNNIKSFVNLKGSKNDDVIIKIIWKIEDSTNLLKLINHLEIKKEEKDTINRLKRIFEDFELKINYYNLNNGEVIIKSNESFLDIKIIEANNVKDDNILSNSFNEIMKYYIHENKKRFDQEVSDINEKIQENILNNNNKEINEKLSKGNFGSKIKVKLESALTVDDILKDIVEYGYQEEDYVIKQSRYGLGYTRIILILSEILHYANNYKDSEKNIKANIIYIEEPEVFMHPQLQKLFMKNLSDLVSEFLKLPEEDKRKNINSQLIVSTHSDHILNSKIEQSKSFNNINYIHFDNSNLVKVKNLTDEDVSTGDTLNFIIKHMKNNMEHLFFSDSIIFVEGITEYFYIKQLLEDYEGLKDKFVSVYLVGGAHAHKYIKLIESLNIPTAIITDIDIKKLYPENNGSNKENDKNFKTNQIKNFQTTNHTFKNLLNIDGASEQKEMMLVNVFEKVKQQDSNKNFKIFTQTAEIYTEILPTSFEEAIIIDNLGNEKFNKVLENTLPKIYENHKDQIKDNSHLFQRRLDSGSRKTTFVGNLIESYIELKDNINIPIYIKEALDYLSGKLK